MRVAMYYNNQDVRVEEMPVPAVGPGELLVRVEASGICGSDVMEWYRIARAPLVLGHELAGVVTQVGDGVDRYRVGDRVLVTHHVPCNTCYHCLNGHHTVCDTLRQTTFDPGGFTEYLRVPAINVDRGVCLLPEEVSFEDATFVEPLGCVLRAQQRAALPAGRSVLVLGSGLTGLLHIQLAGALGAGRIMATDMVDYRLEAARRFGAEAVFRASEDVPARLLEVNEGRLADLVVVCTGAIPALQQALQSVERGGTVLFFAPTEPGATLSVSVNDTFFRNNVTLTTSYAAGPADLATALELIRSRRVRVGDMITHRLGLADTGLGFKLTSEAQSSLKVIVEPQR
ncbi:MAG: alcohol dehydrogenase catalytic domain-containing protein [Dehalococcoidia bacterium]|jgi:L-iditol 2-dehydrogenase|nr:alcohol dehydrogenase catalytic domain-containing protein [Dehalococcoidia bacterium]MDP6226106.1 alcohol dehydrogenase catalytic domain-containing protein [Dehalococcoidia bacterium]MDP7085472.1 alcohol dehydrogenase catalytic domain-containing protein [Dehalococcoidia bacterium]MDP7199742.1 alcohol dehydrogenase catalytic domain-containing protein [Dehalococcoidia bacterium]HJN86392.1 alcohol dehydrogenase catalytic domain-containing protein [Dehalococcoidia bacterium]